MIASPKKVRQPADARHRVIAFGMTLAFLSYLDRACISQAAPMTARDLHFSAIQMGYIFSAPGGLCWLVLGPVTALDRPTTI